MARDYEANSGVTPESAGRVYIESQMVVWQETRKMWKSTRLASNSQAAHQHGQQLPIMQRTQSLLLPVACSEAEGFMSQWDWMSSLLDPWSLGPGSKRKAWSTTGPHAEPCNACVSHKLVC